MTDLTLFFFWLFKKNWPMTENKLGLDTM